jgi:hypothetical protein
MAEHEHHFVELAVSRGQHDICGHRCPVCEKPVQHEQETIAVRRMGRSPTGKIIGGWHRTCAQILVDQMAGMLAAK